MNKYGLACDVADRVGISKKDASIIVDAVLDSISDALQSGERVQLVGFGSFEVRSRASREGRNPRKPEENIKIPPSTVPVFKAGKALKDAVK